MEEAVTAIREAGMGYREASRGFNVPVEGDAEKKGWRWMQGLDQLSFQRRRIV